MIQSFVKCLNPHFNSIKVQLEQYKIMAQSKGFLFQFHKGTIRTAVMIKRLALIHISIP